MALLETAQVYGHSYGTSIKDVKSQLLSDDIILEIEWRGAQQVRKTADFHVVSIFIVPPSLVALKQRLESRGEDSISSIEERLSQAKDELSHCGEYDYIVINDDFQQALSQLESIVVANRCARLPYPDLLKQLLSGEVLENKWDLSYSKHFKEM